MRLADENGDEKPGKKGKYKANEDFDSKIGLLLAA